MQNNCICELLFGAALLLILNHYIVSGQQDDECLYAVGRYRNCTCGVEHRIIEQRCCTSEICSRPVLTSENFTCPFECSNGGTFDPVNRQCLCATGFYGACCHKETPSCGDIFLKHRGEFSSPGYPDDRYPSSTQCVWRISTDPTRRIALAIIDNHFDVEPGSNIYSCDYDSVTVFDGNSDKVRSLGQFCGNIDFPRTFTTVYSNTSNLYVKFSSDYIIQRIGFRLQYSVFFIGQECGPKSTYTRPKGIITSPQYPLQYRPREDCQWTIEVIPGKEVVLVMNEIDMPARSDCRFGDYLLVSGTQGEATTEFGVYCGTQAFKPYRIYGEYDEIVLKFHSNSKFQGKGFSLEYEQVDVLAVSGTSSEENISEDMQVNMTGPELLISVHT